MPFENTLGMKFVPVPRTDVLFGIHEVRHRDYAAYAKENPGINAKWQNQTHEGFALTERLEERTCGVWAVNIQNGQTVGWVKFEDAVQEIFAVSALRGVTYPDLVNHDIDILAGSFVLPDEALAQVPAGYRGEKSGTDETPDGGGEASADTAKGSA